jgi:hypothetical protein
MKALTKVLAGGVGLAALASAAPAAAQYYPGYPGNPGYGYGGNVVGQVLQSILGANRYAGNDRYLIDRCAIAVQQRIDGQFGYRYGQQYGYGYGQPYGYGYGQPYGYAQPRARVLSITRVDRRSSGLRIRGIATAGMQAGYGYNPYGYAQQVGELSFRCNVDWRGRILDIDLDRNNYAYGPYGRRY